MGKRLAGALALVLGVAAFAGPAYAGNGNGNGNNNGKTDTSAAPGNSAAAPGQVKKDAGASGETTTTTTTTTTATTATTTVSVGSGSVPAGQGVKPANDTAHDTHAPASSTKTKLYGNGHTAGQIAIRNGAAPSTVLHGPGNSQPHKATPCAGRHHEVDVHALKGKRPGHGCGSVTDPPGSNPPGSNPEPHPGHTSDPSGPSNQHPSASATGPRSHSGSPRASRGLSGSEPLSRSSAPVLATAERPAGATLPFTGFPLWLGLVLGVVLLGLGLTLSLLAGRETERKVGP